MKESESFQSLEKALEGIDEQFNSGTMKAFGKNQELIMESFNKIIESQELFSQEIDVLKKSQINTSKAETDEKSFDSSITLDSTSLKRVNDTLDHIFESLEEVTKNAKNS